jgi:hypothetical protein
MSPRLPRWAIGLAATAAAAFCALALPGAAAASTPGPTQTLAPRVSTLAAPTLAAPAGPVLAGCGRRHHHDDDYSYGRSRHDYGYYALNRFDLLDDDYLIGSRHNYEYGPDYGDYGY